MAKLNRKLAKMKYEQAIEVVVKQVADRMMQAFEEWNKTKYRMTKEKNPEEEKTKAKNGIDESKENDI